MKILISGATGMLGKVLVKDCISNGFNITTIGRTDPRIPNANHINFDFINSSSNKIISDETFDFIVHCAANTDHKNCDTNISDCFETNALSIVVLKKKFPEAFFILISSDAVFDDSTINRRFDSPTKSRSKYGISKEIAERLTILFQKYLVIRTTIVGFSDEKKSLCDWIVNNLKEKKNVNLFDDVLFNPVSIYELSQAITFIICNPQNYTSRILHVNNSDTISKYEFGKRLAKSLNLDEGFIKKGSLNDFNNKGERNFNQHLQIESKDLEFIFNYKPSIEKSLKTIIENYEIDKD